MPKGQEQGDYGDNRSDPATDCRTAEQNRLPTRFSLGSDSRSKIGNRRTTQVRPAIDVLALYPVRIVLTSGLRRRLQIKASRLAPNAVADPSRPLLLQLLLLPHVFIFKRISLVRVLFLGDEPRVQAVRLSRRRANSLALIRNPELANPTSDTFFDWSRRYATTSFMVGNIRWHL